MSYSSTNLQFPKQGQEFVGGTEAGKEAGEWASEPQATPFLGPTWTLVTEMMYFLLSWPLAST